ncbi:hypothetical protein [Bacteroides sp.]|uniref:hypothetical protein n=1 Tax=Bacteroides sp. TaxID=29523 RepID=UPI002614FDEF|nr:hypothetical protein [Bacteroides sp.]MDD3037152.1 hypothetical protein [Bacteroides sp.]
MESIEKQDVKSKKDLFIERMKAKRPDLNYEDEDALYGSINDDYDSYDGELKGYKKNEEKLLRAFNKDPRVASMFLAMTNGENPLLYLIDNFGQDEIRTALDDPDMKEKIVEKQNAYLERQSKNSKLEEEAKRNILISMDALEEARNELGGSDEDADKAFEMFAQIQEDAIVDKVTKETWMMLLKGLNHDMDIENAAYEAEIKGRNARIDKEKKKKTVPEGIPPQLGGQGALNDNVSKRPIIEGALAKYSDDDPDDIWKRGRK